MRETFPSLRSGDERLRLIEERLSVGTWSWDRGSEQTTWSPGFYRLIGVDPAAVAPSLGFLESLAHPQDRLPLSDPELIATDSRQRSRRLRIIRPDGELRWLLSTAQTAFDRNGVVTRVTAVVADISEAEELRRLVKSLREMNTVISRLIDVEFWKADDQGNLLDSSSWQTDYSQTPPSVFVGGWSTIVPEAEHPAIREAWARAVATGTDYVRTHGIVLGDGTQRQVHVRGTRFVDPAADGDRWVGIATLRPDFVDGPEPGARQQTADLSAAQIRSARAFLDWSAHDLAQRAHVSLSTVRRVELATGQGSRPSSLQAIRAAFHTAGLEFLEDGQGRRYFVPRAAA